MNKLFNFKIKYTEPKKEREWNTKKQLYEEKIINEEYEKWNYSKIVIFSIISLFLIITICSSFTTVRSGEVGLRVRFGKIVDASLNEGINFKIPYIEKISKVNIKVQKVELGTESSSKDLQTITTKLAVNYKVDNEKASNLYKTVGNSYQETILVPAIQESIKAVMSEYTAEQTITKRNEVSDKCLDEIQNKMEKYGIHIVEFNIIDLDFSPAYNQAIEQKVVAEQNVLKAQQELEKTKIEAEKKIVEAEATNKANQLLKQNVTDEVLMKQFIEKWDGKLPETYAGGDILKMFNLK